jgi:uncharacterized protein
MSTSPAADHPGDGAPQGRRLSPVAWLLAGLIHAYRLVRAGRPSPCRFEPSCSQYGLDALHEHGALRGGWLTLRRIGRCRPGGGLGYDPVPLSTRKAAHV